MNRPENENILSLSLSPSSSCIWLAFVHFFYMRRLQLIFERDKKWGTIVKSRTSCFLTIKRTFFLCLHCVSPMEQLPFFNRSIEPFFSIHFPTISVNQNYFFSIIMKKRILSIQRIINKFLLYCQLNSTKTKGATCSCSHTEITPF